VWSACFRLTVRRDQHDERSFVCEREIEAGDDKAIAFEHMDQIDFTGPFEVLSRMPDTTIQLIGKELAPIRDVQGLRLAG